MGMTDEDLKFELDLRPIEFFIEILRDRLEARERAYLFAWGSDLGDEWWYATSVDYEHVQTIYEHCMEDFESELYDSANWNPTEEELLQWEADSEEFDEEED